MSESFSQFQFKQQLSVSLLGPRKLSDPLHKSLTSVLSIRPIYVDQSDQLNSNTDVIVALLESADSKEISKLAWLFQTNDFKSAHKIIYLVPDNRLSQQEILCFHEIGANRVFFGLRREEELKAHLKKRSVEILEIGTVPHIERLLMAAIQIRDMPMIDEQLDKLRHFPKDHEDSLRLRILAYEGKADWKKMVLHLKQMLSINPQSLWAANLLGRYFIKAGEIPEGIEVLHKLSHFHDLNAERLFHLGDAYLNMGRPDQAQTALEKGSELTGGTDQRFQEGLAKAELLRGEMDKALKLTGKKSLSLETLSYLNTRAIMAIRMQRFADGNKFYEMALAGCDAQNPVVLSKLKFNLGLSYVREKKFNLAMDVFADSARLGGSTFDRAAGLLQKTKRLAEMAASTGQTATASEPPVLADEEWETFTPD